MGDRANFAFKQSDGNTIVLYGHWAGYEMLAKLAHAVAAAEPRWSDESYATRIAISDLVGEDWNSETGWGLYVNVIGDNEHKIPVINWATMTFSLIEDGPMGFDEAPIFSLTLKEFVDKYSRVLV